MYMLSVILFVLGALILLFSKQLGDLSYKINRPFLKAVMGSFVDLDKPWLKTLYRISAFVVGTIAIILGFFEYLNPTILR